MWATHRLTPALRAGPPSGTSRAAPLHKQAFSQHDDNERFKELLCTLR